MFSTGFISGLRDFTPYFHFRCVARATFHRNLIHSADACFVVMTCVGYARVLAAKKPFESPQCLHREKRNIRIAYHFKM